jgi:hypothetical protein
MITRPILEAQREIYQKACEQHIAQMTALNGAIEAIDNLLKICAQEEEAQAAVDKPAKTEGDPNA